MNWLNKLVETFGGRNSADRQEALRIPVMQICIILCFVAFLVMLLGNSNQKKSLLKLAEANCKLKMPGLCGADPYCKADPATWCTHLSTFCYENTTWEDTRCNLVGLR